MIQITTAEDRLELRAPFHPELASQAKSLRGRWLGPEAGWSFEHRHQDALRALCLRLWGVDGTPQALANLVDIRVVVDERDIRSPIWSAMNGAVYLVGREIAASLKNRKAARPGRGVTFVRGRPACRTELHDYWTSIPNGSVFVLKDVPLMALTHIECAVTGHGTIGRLTA